MLQLGQDWQRYGMSGTKSNRLWSQPNSKDSAWFEPYRGADVVWSGLVLDQQFLPIEVDAPADTGDGHWHSLSRCWLFGPERIALESGWSIGVPILLPINCWSDCIASRQFYEERTEETVTIAPSASTRPNCQPRLRTESFSVSINHWSSVHLWMGPSWSAGPGRRGTSQQSTVG